MAQCFFRPFACASHKCSIPFADFNGNGVTLSAPERETIFHITFYHCTKLPTFTSGSLGTYSLGVACATHNTAQRKRYSKVNTLNSRPKYKTFAVERFPRAFATDCYCYVLPSCVVFWHGVLCIYSYVHCVRWRAAVSNHFRNHKITATNTTQSVEAHEL